MDMTRQRPIYDLKLDDRIILRQLSSYVCSHKTILNVIIMRSVKTASVSITVYTQR